MPQALRATPLLEAPLFSDGVGDRVVSPDTTTGELVQVLRINPALTAVPSFEFALRERVARLANFRHQSFARVRRVDRAPSHTIALALVSDHTEGTRLSDILRVVDERGLHLDINAALSLLRQLVSSVALLHENARDAAHGLIAPERLVVTSNGRLVIVEHVFGAAVEQMQYGRERLWHEFGVAMPPSAGIPRFDQRADVTGIGLVALSLVLGRRLRPDEFPRALSDLINNAQERTAPGQERPLSPQLRTWLARALQLDPRRAFASAPEALASLDEITGDGSAYVSAPIALEMFLSQYVGAVLTPTQAVPPAPAPAAVPSVQEPAATAAAPRPEPAPAELPPVEDLDEQEAAKPLFDPDNPFTAAPEPSGGARAPRLSKRLLFAAAAVVVLASGSVAGYKVLAGSAAAPSLATLSVNSNPTGVPIFVDGVERGVTPAKLTLAPGAHILELRRGVPRVIPVTLTAGADVSQYLEFAETPLPTDMIVEARPEPAPAAAVAPPGASEAPLAGWVAVKIPFSAEIREQGRLLGTTDADRLMLAAGSHVLEFSNEPLGFKVSRTVQIAPGKVVPIIVEVPKGTLNLNASPWAEVWLDGQRIGETPIGNLSVTLGAHEVVFKHPQFGERKHAVSVTAGAPVRLSVEMK